MMTHVTLRDPDGHLVYLAGGILGLAEEEDRCARFLEEHAVDQVLLGIPFEDLDAIRGAPEKPPADAFEKDEVDEAYLQALSRFGPVKVPPGDLYAAHAYATTHGRPVEAIDLGDEGHANVWAEHVGFFELVRNNRRMRRIPAAPVASKTAVAFASEWDGILFPTKGLRKVQMDRETWMGRRVMQLAPRGTRTFVLVPLARMQGVERKLVDEHGFTRAPAMGDADGPQTAMAPK